MRNLVAMLLAGCVASPADEPEQELGYSADGCPTSYLLASPVAQQCCWDADHNTMVFVSASGDSSNLVVRQRNPYGYPCTASDGWSGCTGADCYFGPNGFSRPEITGTSWPDRWWISNVDCGAMLLDPYDNPPYQFGDVSGTAATGQACPGGASGGSWDYY